MNKVGVIILNYKVKDKVLTCLSSVKKSDYKNLMVYIVDNNSEDSLEKELVKFKDINFLQTGANLGYSGGNNFGIKQALKDGADLILILNPDTKLDKSCISDLVKGMDEYKAGIASPKIYFADKKTLWYAGGVFDDLNILGLHQGVDEQDVGQYNQPKEIEYATGAAVLIKREVFEKIGYFDERFFLYYEDSDFSYRARKAKFKIYFIPEAIVYHENAQSTKLGSGLQDYFITRNRLLYASKYSSLRTLFALIREVLRNLKYRSRRVALYDFIFNNFGKGSFI